LGSRRLKLPQELPDPKEVRASLDSMIRFPPLKKKRPVIFDNLSERSLGRLPRNDRKGRESAGVQGTLAREELQGTTTFTFAGI